MNVIVIGRKKFTGPKDWSELTNRHVRQLLNWRLQLGSEPAGKFVLLQLWYGIRYRHWRRLDDDQRTDILTLLDFLDERPDRWLLPRLRVGARTYAGPGDGLDYLTFGEFIHAQSARDRYLATSQAQDLSELLASLYRPRAWLPFQKSGEGDRQLFDIRRHASEILIMGSVPESIRQGVLMNYEGCLDRFPVQFEHLFKSSDGDGSGTWLNVGLSLARQTSALGSFQEMEGSNLFLVLTTLDAVMKENQELKEKLDKHG